MCLIKQTSWSLRGDILPSSTSVLLVYGYVLAINSTGS
jgi:hypothetical protein